MKFLITLVVATIAASVDGSEVLQEFTLGNNLFAADIYKQFLKGNSGDFLLCPLSAEIILALVHNGAGGKTAKQLSSGLHIPESPEKVQQSIQQLLPLLESGEKYVLHSANKIYVKDGVKIKDQFKHTAVDVFKSDIQNINFLDKAHAEKVINGWVEEKTDHKITNLVSGKDFDEDTRAVLVNAMYFHGKWVNEFPERGTKLRSFYAPDRQTNIKMMHQLNYQKYFESSELNAKFLEIPYEGNNVTLTIALPNNKNGLPALESHIEEVLSQHSFEKHFLQVAIPKFQIKSTIEYVPILRDLGITEPFLDTAEFTGILESTRLKISSVIQKTFIEVEEKGTVASAATAVELPLPISSNYEPPVIDEFIADHPFIYFIKIRDIICFVGRYTGV